MEEERLAALQVERRREEEKLREEKSLKEVLREQMMEFKTREAEVREGFPRLWFVQWNVKPFLLTIFLLHFII